MAQKKNNPVSSGPFLNGNVEIHETTDHRVRCDGGKGALGHPTIYMEMGENDHVVCPYCSRTFVYKDGYSH